MPARPRDGEVIQPPPPTQRQPPLVAQFPPAPPAGQPAPPAAPPKPAQPPQPTGAQTPPAGSQTPPPPGAPPAQPPAAPPIGGMVTPPKGNGVAAGGAATTPVGTGATNQPPPVVVPPAAKDLGATGQHDTSTATATEYTGPDVQFQKFGPASTQPGPSDFVSFNDFAGLNGEALKGIADKAAAQSASARADAMKSLQKAESEATADTPVEKTASYAEFLAKLKAAGDSAQGFATQGTYNPTTGQYEGGASGNYMEDALRGVYSGAQNARDARLSSDAMTQAKLGAKGRNDYLAAQAKAAADAKAKADAAKQAADAKKAQRDDLNEQRREVGLPPLGPDGKPKGTSTRRPTGAKQQGDV